MFRHGSPAPAGGEPWRNRWASHRPRRAPGAPARCPARRDRRRFVRPFCGSL